MTKDTKRDAILEAADDQFRQYGYRKTSMDDIAKRLGISRASLYSYFQNKDDIFRGVASVTQERALLAARVHLTETPNCSPEQRIERALLARHLPFLNAVVQSSHGSELFDEYSRLCGDIVQDSHRRFQAMLASALRVAVRKGELDLKSAGVSAATAAEWLNLAAAGLKHGAAELQTFEKRIKGFVRVFVRGVSAET